MRLSRKTILLLFFLIAGIFSAFSQANPIDSLKWKLDQEAPRWPAHKVVPLFLELGMAYINAGQSSSALIEIERGLQLAETEKLTALKLSFMLQKGRAYYYLDKFSEAKNLFRGFLKTAGKSRPVETAIAHSYMSKIFQIKGSFDLAYKHATDDLLVREKERDSIGMAKALNQIGSIHLLQENPQLALSKFKKAQVILEDSGDEKSLLETYSALATVHKKLNRKDKSLRFNRKALALAEKYNYLPGIAEGKINNAGLYMELGLYELAYAHYVESQQLFEALDNKVGQVEAGKGMGYSSVKSGNYEMALGHLDDASCLAEEIEANNQLSLIYKYQAEANAALGFPQYAYDFLYKYTALRDSIFNETSWKEMGSLKNKYELDSRENEIALLKAEKNLLAKEQKIKGLYWFLLFIFSAFFSGLVFILYSKWKMQTRLLKLLEHREKKIKVQNGKLAQSNLDLEHFASVASHDLREPLRMINSYTKLLNRRYGDSFDSGAKEFMHFIMDAATRMDSMLVDLLDYSRAEKKGERAQWIESKDLLNTALENLKFKISKKNVIIDYSKSHLPQLYANKTAMIQLFQNLISNAVKFSNEAQPEVVIDCVKRGPYYRFSIRDNGIGIDKEKQAKIFEMFTRLHTREEFEGSGIGLATCKKIVEREGGKIWVESEPGEGSTFFFTIPQDVSSN